MALPDINAIDFGYVTGADLTSLLPVTFLQNIYVQNSGNPLNNSNIIQLAVKKAKARVNGALMTLYNIAEEYAITGYQNPATDFRNGIIVQLVVFFACYEIASNSDNIKSPLRQSYKEMLNLLDQYRSRSQTIPDLPSALPSVRSGAYFINNNYRYKR